MKNLVVEIQPFDFKQRMYIFDNGILISQITATMQDLPQRILATAAADEITNISIRGAVDFTQKIKEEIRAEEVTKYGKHILEIDLV